MAKEVRAPVNDCRQFFSELWDAKKTCSTSPPKENSDQIITDVSLNYLQREAQGSLSLSFIKSLTHIFFIIDLFFHKAGAKQFQKKNNL